MKKVAIIKPAHFRVLFVCLFALPWLFLKPQPALAQDFAPVEGACMGTYQNPVNCTAQDLRIKEILDVTYEKICDGVPDEDGYDMLTATFTMLVSAEQTPNRYDIGIFMAKYGNDASGTGVCYRDYLAPLLVASPVYGDFDGDSYLDIFEKYPYNPAYFTGWWDGDGDACGDMEDGTQVLMTNVTITIACHDTDSPDDTDTNADISVCVAWDEQAKNDCTSYADAGPATPAKCSCEVLNFPFTPTALTQMSLEAHEKTFDANLMLAGAGLLLVTAGLSSFLLYRRARAA